MKHIDFVLNILSNSPKHFPSFAMLNLISHFLAQHILHLNLFSYKTSILLASLGQIFYNDYFFKVVPSKVKIIYLLFSKLTLTTHQINPVGFVVMHLQYLLKSFQKAQQLKNTPPEFGHWHMIKY